MKHVKQLLSALLVLAVVLSLLPAGVLKASAAEALAALDIGYPTFKNTELLDESMTCRSSVCPIPKRTS